MKERKRLFQRSYRVEEVLVEEVETWAEVRKANKIEPSSQNAIVNDALRYYFEYLKENPPLRKVS